MTAPATIVGLLGHDTRLRVFAAVVLGSTSAEQVVSSTGMATREVMTALRRLADGELVTIVDGALVARTDTLREAARSREPQHREPQDPDRVRDAVLRAFFVDGRLTAIPVNSTKRQVVLEHVVVSFTAGVRYPEPEVNAILRAWHDDYVTLRRCLIDADLLDREQAVYWRIGGPIS